MEHVWTVLTERIITDKKTNQVSLIDTVEEIKAVFPPGPVQVYPIPFDAWFVSLWTRSDATKPEKGRFRISWIGPAGEILIPPRPEGEELDLTEKIRVRISTHMISVPSNGNGRYNYIVEQEIEAQWVRVAKIPVDVTIEEEEPKKSWKLVVETPKARVNR